MTNHTEKQLCKHREKMVDDYRLARLRQHPHFKTVYEVATFYQVTRKHLWQLSRRRDKYGSSGLLPKKQGPKRPAHKTPQWLVRTIVKIHRHLGYRSERIAVILNERGITITGRTIRNILKKHRLPKAKKLKIVRYEHPNPGDLGHIDVKKLPNIKGNSPKEKFYLAALLDDNTRLTYQEKLPSKSAKQLSGFLCRAIRWFKEKHNIVFKRIISDNGKEFTTHHKKARKKHLFEKTLKKLGIKHCYTRPYRPQTNGKVERYWKIWENECWNNQTFLSWENYEQHQKGFLHYYNYQRRHGGIGYKAPVVRLNTWKDNKLNVILQAA